MLWKCCEHFVNNLVSMWWNYEYFVIISRTIWWTRGEHVETMSWTFCEHFVNICCTFGEGRRQLLMKDNSRVEGPEPEGAPCFLPLIAWTGAAWKKRSRGRSKKKLGAEATKNMRLMYWLLENKKHKEIVHLLHGELKLGKQRKYVLCILVSCDVYHHEENSIFCSDLISFSVIPLFVDLSHIYFLYHAIHICVPNSWYLRYLSCERAQMYQLFGTQIWF